MPPWWCPSSQPHQSLRGEVKVKVNITSLKLKSASLGLVLSPNSRGLLRHRVARAPSFSLAALALRKSQFKSPAVWFGVYYLTSCTHFSLSFPLWKQQHAHLCVGTINTITHLVLLIWESNELVYVKHLGQCLAHCKSTRNVSCIYYYNYLFYILREFRCQWLCNKTALWKWGGYGTLAPGFSFPSTKIALRILFAFDALASQRMLSHSGKSPRGLDPCPCAQKIRAKGISW